MLRIGNAIGIIEHISGMEFLLSVYPSLPGVGLKTCREATQAETEPTTHLRFDPISACNVSCVFCHSDFSGRAGKAQELRALARSH